jgi:hypothetical protein
MFACLLKLYTVAGTASVLSLVLKRTDSTVKRVQLHISGPDERLQIRYSAVVGWILVSSCVEFTEL